MRVSIEKGALRLLMALKKEQEREPDIIKCRRIGVVADSLFSSQDEFNAVVNFCIERRLLDSTRRDDGLASFVSREGDEFIERHSDRWTLANRLAALAVIAALIAAVVVFFESCGGK